MHFWEIYILLNICNGVHKCKSLLVGYHASSVIPDIDGLPVAQGGGSLDHHACIEPVYTKLDTAKPSTIVYFRPSLPCALEQCMFPLCFHHENTMIRMARRIHGMVLPIWKSSVQKGNLGRTYITFIYGSSIALSVFSFSSWELTDQNGSNDLGVGEHCQFECPLLPSVPYWNLGQTSITFICGSSILLSGNSLIWSRWLWTVLITIVQWTIMRPD